MRRRHKRQSKGKIAIHADTYTHKSFSNSFLESLLPRDTMLTYLGREKESQAIYPECGFVGYNLKHPEIQNFINDWEKLYSTDEIFNLLEWHDSAVLWHLSKKYIAEKNIKINDIGHGAGASGHHVFVNSELGIYIDHFKGEKRKIARRSAKDDFKTIQPFTHYAFACSRCPADDRWHVFRWYGCTFNLSFLLIYRIGQFLETNYCLF